MKKILLILIIFLISIQAYCDDKTYNLANNVVSVSLTQTDNNIVYFSNIINQNTGTSVILEDIGKKVNIWTLVVKKSRQYASEEITLTSDDAEKLITKEQKDSITLIWKDVKKDYMKKGFDIIVTGDLKADGTYWHIKVNSKTKDYGIWSVVFPEMILNFEDGDELLIPLFSGWVETKNTPGRPEFKSRGYKNLPEIDYPIGDIPFQVTSLTKNKSGIYICPEDNDGWHKKFYWGSINNKEINYRLRAMPNDQGVGGISYNQEYLFNISPLSGDWYTAIKKYRKWGIENNNTPFKRGRLKDRTDVPEWMKKNSFWGMYKNKTTGLYERIIDKDLTNAFHLYAWWHLPHDNGYPEMLPVSDDIYTSFLDSFKEQNIKTVYYTNPHLIDAKNSPLFKKYGYDVCNLNEDLKPKNFDWGGGTTINHAACPSLKVVQDTIVNLHKTLVKDYSSSGEYLDEICVIAPEPCFNEKHGHPVGTGNRWSREYRKLFDRVKEECNKISDEPIIIYSESIGEPYSSEAQLQLLATPDMPYCNSTLYSGYRFLFGMQYNNIDVEPSEQPGIEKMAYTLCGGWQLGWYFWFNKPVKEYKDFNTYMQNAVRARNNAVDYFNLGEMVRCVEITNNIPKIETFIGDKNYDVNVPSVQTSSFYLDGKTMVVFTNITTNEQKVEWKSSPSDLYLENKSTYKINQNFPSKEDLSNADGKIYGNLIMAPLETKIIIIE